MTRRVLTSQRWADLAAWRCAGEPWEPIDGSEIVEASPQLVCRCGASVSAHAHDLEGAPLIDAVNGVRRCPGFDPVARQRRVTRWELQTARVDRKDETP